MRRLRDVFYVNANYEESYFLIYGLEFNEFIRYNPTPLNNILLLDPALYLDPINNSMFMSTVSDSAILELCKEDVHNFGNFHWMDYRDNAALARCTEQEKAEILYLSHYLKPLGKSFFDSIGNNFVYLAHDDGWFCQLYCKDMSIFGDIIANKIIAYFSTNRRRKIYPLSEEIKKRFLDWARDGLLINFQEATLTGRTCGLSFYTIGKYDDMDTMYHDVNKKIQFAHRHGWIEQKNKVWNSDFSEHK